ncbi:MAG: hypothetical protein AB7K68_06595 [Bacteriovoracia bacterium]
MKYFFLLLLLGGSAQAEFCPTYNNANPTMVVDVSQFKFFYYPKTPDTNDPNVVQVVKDRELFDTQKVYYWADEEADEISLHNKNISLTCTMRLDFISGEYAAPTGANFYFAGGDCRQAGDYYHPLFCD